MCVGVSRKEEKFLKARGLIMDKRQIEQDLRFISENGC